MLSFLSNLNNFFFSLLRHLENNADQEIVSSAALGSLLILFILLQRKTSGALSRETEKYRSYVYFLSDLIFPFIYLFITEVAGFFLRGDFSLIFFHSVAYFYLGFFIIKNLLKPLYADYFPWNLSSYLLLSTSILSLLVTDLNDRFFRNSGIHEAFFLVFKVSLIFLTYIFLFKGVKSAVSSLPFRLRYSGQVFKNLVTFLSIIFFIVSILWLLKFIQLSSSFFMGIVLSIIAFVIYSLIRTYFRTYIRPKIENREGTYPGLIGNIRLFLTLILALVLYEIFKPLFNLDPIINSLNRVYIIKTDLISISVFSVISAIYVFILLLSLINILKHAAYFYYIRRNREVEAGSIRAIVLNVGILIVILISLSLLGLTWKALLPIAGALGIGIGIGLQEIMNNYISGFILLFSKKLKVGDIVEMDGNAGRAIGNTLETIYGRVKSIDILSTIVATTDGIEVVIPNSQFISQQIVNYSLSDSYIRVRIPFGVSYSSDPNAVRDILLNVTKENPLVLESPAPSVWFSEMGESALVFHLLCWVNIRMLWRINPLVSDIYFKGWYELEKAGVVIPFPQRDVWFKNNLKIEVEKETADKFEGDLEFNNMPGIRLTKKTDLPD